MFFCLQKPPSHFATQKPVLMFFCLQKPHSHSALKNLSLCSSVSKNPTLILSLKNLSLNAIIAVFRLISWLWGGVFVTLQSQINR